MLDLVEAYHIRFNLLWSSETRILIISVAVSQLFVVYLSPRDAVLTLEFL
jgi:hypothetical protein